MRTLFQCFTNVNVAHLHNALHLGVHLRDWESRGGCNMFVLIYLENI